ncbi:MAG: decaprenyl-phosphate phosphoribosyltransferase [Gemmatimonadota bacterium]|jgi:4-hydroxybenzoate polyprenyltransferase
MSTTVLADGAAETGAGAASFSDWVRLIRPRQWAKNGFVLAPLLFSGQFADTTLILRAAAAFGLFCMLASGVYCWNDVADRVVDRSHPTKRNRPIARGVISPGAGRVAGALLITIALAGAWLLTPWLGATMLVYIGLGVVYNRVLKSLVILDVFAIAGFFLLRLIAGSVAVDVRPSVWLLLCGGLLANYLGFTKRRHELAIMGEDSTSHRSVLEHYDIGLLDQMSVILLSVTVVSYLMYTLTSQTAAQVGELLSYSTVFVLYGMFRYLYLVHFGGKGGDPTETLLRDKALLIDVVLWLAYCGWVIYRPF